MTDEGTGVPREQISPPHRFLLGAPKAFSMRRAMSPERSALPLSRLDRVGRETPRISAAVFTERPFFSAMIKTYATAGFAFLLLVVFPHVLQGQDIEDLKKGVVKITAQVEGKTKVGTGFIVRLEKDAAYIVTASHVIEGDPKPQITFFPQPQLPFTAQIIGMEPDKEKGLAALRDSPARPRKA